MKNLQIKRVVKITAYFTPAQWGLYTESAEPVDIAADALNAELVRCVNLGYTKEDTSRFVRSVMRHFSTTGADDTEPHCFLEQVLDEIYGQPLEF